MFLASIYGGLHWQPALYPLFVLSWISVLVFAAAFSRSPHRAAIAVLVLASLLGFYRGSDVARTRAATPLLALGPGVHEFLGQVVTVPAPQRNSVRFTLAVEGVDGRGLTHRSNLTVVARPFPEVAYGSRVSANCRVTKEERGANRGGPVCLFPEIVTEGPSDEHSVAGLLTRGRLVFVRALSRVFPAPSDGFIAGILAGGTGGLSQSWRNAFITTGTIHLVALSGFNITLIAGFLGLALRALTVHRRFVAPLTAVVLSAFVVAVGASASVVRAAIMGMLVVVAQSRGRPSDVRNAIAFTAAAMAAVSPTAPFFDIGFQLSFLATLGIIYGYPILERWFSWMPEFWRMREALLMSLAAEVAVTPLLLFYFGRLSLVAPLVNTVVVPLIPFTMLFGFLGGLCGLVSTAVGQVAGLPAWLATTFILKVIAVGARVPAASIDMTLPLTAVVLCYAVLLIALIRFSQPRVRIERQSP